MTVFGLFDRGNEVNRGSGVIYFGRMKSMSDAVNFQNDVMCPVAYGGVGLLTSLACAAGSYPSAP